MKFFKVLVGTAAALTMVQSQVAMAQTAKLPCVEPADLSDAVIYAMPSLISAFGAKCGSKLAASGFMNTGGAQMSAKYAAQQSATWPGAQRLIMQFATSSAKAKNDGIANMLGGLPPEALRPFVDAIIQQQVSEKIPVKECGNIERGISYLAPLPPENMGGLVSFVMELADVKKPSLCENKAP